MSPCVRFATLLYSSIGSTHVYNYGVQWNDVWREQGWRTNTVLRSSDVRLPHLRIFLESGELTIDRTDANVNRWYTWHGQRCHFDIPVCPGLFIHFERMCVNANVSHSLISAQMTREERNDRTSGSAVQTCWRHHGYMRKMWASRIHSAQEVANHTLLHFF